MYNKNEINKVAFVSSCRESVSFEKVIFLHYYYYFFFLSNDRCWLNSAARVYCESNGRKFPTLPASNLTLVVSGFCVAAGEIGEIWDIWERGVGENGD